MENERLLSEQVNPLSQYLAALISLTGEGKK